MHRQVFQYHPLIGYTFVPGLRARLENDVSGYLVRVNALGFRSEHEFVERKKVGVARILLFGDSFTAGDSVSNRDRYGDMIEALVPGVEVYNFGLSGTGTDQQYLIYREFGVRFECDLVIIGVLVENIRRVAARYRQVLDAAGKGTVLAKPYFELQRDGTLALHQVPVPKEPIDESELPRAERAKVDSGGEYALLRSAVNALGSVAKEHVQRLVRFQPLPAYDSADNADWRLLRAILQKWVDELKVPVIVCPIPLYHYVEELASPDGYRQRFAELAAGTNVRVHDPLDDFLLAERAERRAFRFPRDIHLTPAGHRVLAESLARVVRDYV
jgi:hypothetical protein